MKIASKIAKEARQGGFLSVGTRGAGDHVVALIDSEFEKFIAAKLEPVISAVHKVRTCVGFVRSECLMCDESGACMIDLLSALGLFEEEE